MFNDAEINIIFVGNLKLKNKRRASTEKSENF